MVPQLILEPILAKNQLMLLTVLMGPSIIFFFFLKKKTFLLKNPLLNPKIDFQIIHL